MTVDSYTDAQIRAIAAALRARGPYGETHRADELDAAVAIEQLLRERGALHAKLEHVSHAVHVVTRDLAALHADEVRRMLREALNEVAS